jgi:hypothetical protein
MSGTVHGKRTARRFGVAVAGVVLLLSGCGGGNDSSGAPATAAAGTTTAAGDADFCSQAADLDKRVDTAVNDLGDDPSIPDAFRQLTAELRAIEAPAPIAADWETMASGLERMADALTDVDFTDPSALDALDAVGNDLTAAGDRVGTYLSDQCGITG